ncbi:exonuclease domain-containing protein [Kitasatospora sp. NPDC057512]|uniref:3'-5' exonuclease n=1 Tax=Kitasatospora sp. NPDC057512 TaxID=3346154 RepID=UPI0036985194
MDYQTWPRVVVVDVEGNAAQPPDLIEVAAIPVAAGQPVPSSARSSLIRPPRPITQPAMRVHRITNQDVARAPTWEQIAERVHADLEGAWIAAHNAHTDYGALLRHLPTWRPAAGCGRATDPRSFRNMAVAPWRGVSRPAGCPLHQGEGERRMIQPESLAGNQHLADSVE